MFEEKWPVLVRHEKVVEWLQVWSDLGRAARSSFNPHIAHA
jgi:integrase/recombinase XerD